MNATATQKSVDDTKKELSKHEIWRRLVRAGMWDEAAQRRLAREKELAKAVGKKEAKSLSWKELAVEYAEALSAPAVLANEGLDDGPDSDSGTSAISPDDAAALSDLAATGKLDLVSDIQFVYLHLAVNVKPADCPSSGAWHLLKWARQNQRDFFKTFVPRLWGITVEEEGPDLTDDEIYSLLTGKGRTHRP